MPAAPPLPDHPYLCALKLCSPARLPRGLKVPEFLRERKLELGHFVPNSTAKATFDNDLLLPPNERYDTQSNLILVLVTVQEKEPTFFYAMEMAKHLTLYGPVPKTNTQAENS